MITLGLDPHPSTHTVVALDENAQVIYTELVDEVTQEPNYTKALDALLK